MFLKFYVASISYDNGDGAQWVVVGNFSNESDAKLAIDDIIKTLEKEGVENLSCKQIDTKIEEKSICIYEDFMDYID